MNDALVLTDAPAGLGSEPRTTSPSRGLILAAVIVVLSLASIFWIRQKAAGSLSQAPAGAEALARDLERSVWLLGLAAAGSGLGVLFTLGGSLAAVRRAWSRRLELVEAEWRTKNSGLQSQLSDTRKTEAAVAKSLAEARAQFAQLAEERSQLQAELDARKKNERTLSQQRLVLESSKTVLEMHVQARTQELHQLQHRYEMILNSAGEGICGLDRQGRATFVNPAVAKITGWPLEELIGKTEQEIFFPKAGQTRIKLCDGDAGEHVFYRKDGGHFPVEFVRTSIEDGGMQTGSVLIFKDITERKRAEETLTQKAAELTRSNAELEQFAFVASHDLQEPLRKIQAFGDRLKAKVEQSLAPEAKDYLERMQNASARMRTLIDDLLAFSRVIRSSQPFVPVDLSKVTKEVLGDLEVRIEKNAARVEVSELPTLNADPTQMRQLMLNLIGNALKFQKPGSQPVVKVHSRTLSSLSGEQFCEITVEDNGIGFEEQYAEKIFAVFQRLHGRGEYEGTGVGLAVCRRITDRHEGTIVARSKLGEGAAFIVTLPMRLSSKPNS